MQIEKVADYGSSLGEGPLWHVAQKRLYWTSIDDGHLFWFDPATGKSEKCYEGRKVGGFTIQADGSLLLFRDMGNVVVWKDGRIVKTVRPDDFAEQDMRFNDVIADPQGRVFCGTMGKRKGKLYRMERDASLTPVVHETGCANGMGFTDGNRRMYFTDTATRTITRCDYDRATGALSNGVPWVVVERKDGEGGPDGMTVDAEGRVWSARWGGWCVVCYDREGKELRRIAVPAPKASCVAFGGEQLDEMYVTTAGGNVKDTDGPHAGALFRIKGVARGVPEYLSRIGL